MAVAYILVLAAAVLLVAAMVEAARDRSGSEAGLGAGERAGTPVAGATSAAAGLPELRGLPARLADRLGLPPRIARAGLGERLPVGVLLAAKAASAVVGAGAAALAAPAAPGRLAIVVAIGLPVAGFMGPDALLERRARARARSLRGALPDALDLLATAASAGRSPLAGLAEIASGDGPLARELSVLVAESSCGTPQRQAFENLRQRVPAKELAAMSGVIERSRRYGSPLAEQLHEQASALRGAHRRRIKEEAARAAPKIQLAVALLLVPSVLLMIAAGLLANVDRFLAGL